MRTVRSCWAFPPAPLTFNVIRTFSPAEAFRIRARSSRRKALLIFLPVSVRAETSSIVRSTDGHSFLKQGTHRLFTVDPPNRFPQERGDTQNPDLRQPPAGVNGDGVGHDQLLQRRGGQPLP